MAQVFVKYNPYKLETQIRLNGNVIEEDNELYKYVRNRRMQEWIGDFPKRLGHVANTRSFEIEFYGLPLDWDDFSYVFRQAQKEGILADVELKFTQGKSADDESMTKQIADVFHDLQEGPVDAFRSPALKKAVENLQNATFPVNVVATMSSGKSTLINAFLGAKLMPAKNEACTAVITEIRDNDAAAFSASVYDQENQLMEEIPVLDYKTMDRLNSDENVFRISVQGNIPFLDAKSMALVLVDTPGSNNSQNQAHRQTTYRAISGDMNNMILYVLNGTQLGTNDDDALLNYVAEQMRKGSKQVRDRFLFVLNKMDGFNPEEENIEHAIQNAILYLNHHGIESPQVFPCSAISGLDIRTVLKQVDLAKPSFTMPLPVQQSLMNVQKLNYYDDLHLERYSVLSPTAKQELDYQLAQAEKDGDVLMQALIHSGICSIEAAIHAYVKKYARTKKVKDVIETFQTVLVESEVFAKAQNQIANDEKVAREYAERAKAIRAYLNDGKEAQKFKDKINAFDPMEKIRETSEKLKEEILQETTKIFGHYDAVITNKGEARRLVASFAELGANAMAKLSVELESIVNHELVETSEALLQEYQEKLYSFDKDVSTGTAGLDLHTVDLVKSALQTMRNSINSWQGDQFANETIGDIGDVTVETKTYYEKVGEEEEQVVVGSHQEKVGTKKVFAGTHQEKVGTRRVKNESKSWWQFWKSSYVEEDVYRTVNDFKNEDVYETVNDYKTVTRDVFEKRTKEIEHFSAKLSDIQVHLVTPLRENMDDGIEKALDHAEEQVVDMKMQFSDMFDVLDQHIQAKYQELEDVASNQEKQQEALEENQKILSWLEANKKEIYDIVEI